MKKSYVAGFNGDGVLRFVEIPEKCDDVCDFAENICDFEQWECIDEIVYFDSNFEYKSRENPGDWHQVKKYLDESLEGYKKEYDPELLESEDIETYGENEFFGGKKESLEDVISYIYSLGL